MNAPYLLNNIMNPDAALKKIPVKSIDIL